MDDLISRQAAIDAVEFGITHAKAIDIETGKVTDLFATTNKELEKAINRLAQLPSAERRGRWILGGEIGFPKWTCTVCGGSGRGDYKICPWCGARMEE